MSSSPPPEPAATALWPGLRGWLPRSLTSRLILSSLLLVALVSVLVGAVTTLTLRRYLVDRLDEQLASASLRHESSDIGGPPGGELCIVLAPGQTTALIVGQPPGTVLALFSPSCRSAVVVTDD